MATKSRNLVEMGNRDVFKSVFNRFKEEYSGEHPSRRFWYSYFKENGEMRKDVGVCSAGVYHLDKETRERGVRLYPSISPTMLKDHLELCKEWYHWVTKESPFKGGLLSKSFAYTYTYGAYVNPKADVFVAHFAMQALRQLQEHPVKILVWKELLDKYIPNPLVAFAIAEYASGSIDSATIAYASHHGDMFDPRLTSLESLSRPMVLRKKDFTSSGYNGVGACLRKQNGEKTLYDLFSPAHDRGSIPAYLCEAQKEIDNANLVKRITTYVSPFKVNKTTISPEAVAKVLYDIFIGGRK